MKPPSQNTFKSTLKHFSISISRAMLCLISCFRTKHSSSHRSHGDFERCDAQYSDYENDKEIRDEAKFLKACGTLLETPIEIRKASKKLNEDSSSQEFHSWLPNSSINELQLDQSPISVHLFDEHTPISCESKTHKSIVNGEDDTESYAAVNEVDADETDDATTPFTPWTSASNVQNRNKSVRFECDFETSAVKESSPWQPSVSKRTPKPTPLKLTDEMQTPGTVFPNNAESYANGKGRIRSQYVYSVSKPTDLCLSVAETN